MYFGYDLGDEYEPDWWLEQDEDGEFDWEDAYAARLGWVSVPFPADYPETDYALPDDERQRIEADYEKSSAAYQEYEASRERRRELLADLTIEIDSFGYEYELNCVRVKASVQTTYGSTQLKPLVADPEWVDQLNRFVELLELKVPEGGPGWHLNCSYG
ncbi:hypothetical protein FG87_21915 [Nocardia vulneris]|uniref:Uncharacterized protein n=1 Tax=Nocardia vulneris TaxID=1141657 RepID=A0ABR4ZCR1_9NOCA|nr:hypothetical protein FG87_21915 [Nocardia vulneris]